MFQGIHDEQCYGGPKAPSSLDPEVGKRILPALIKSLNFGPAEIADFKKMWGMDE